MTLDSQKLRVRSLLIAAALLAVGSITTPARADTPAPSSKASTTSSPAAPASASSPAATRLSNEARAEQLFHSGEKKFDGGDYAGACTDFSESLKLGPKLGTLLNLALCHETVGKVVTAWSEFTHAAAWAAQNNQRDRLEFATSHIRALEPKLSRIVLQLPADRAIASMDLDGEPVSEERWYLPLYLDPGEHRLAVTAPGKKRTTIAFRVTPSPTDQLVMVPPLPNEEPPNPPIVCRPAVPPPKVDPIRRALGIGGVALGAAGIGLGATFGVLAIGADSQSTMKTDATIATAALVSGAVFATVGVWLLGHTTVPPTQAASAPWPLAF